MFLKSLTLRGFKSFADRTTLALEPGISIIVGPNGSGKSNIIDAVSWVLGEQGPRSLRGGRMEDVIFAGTSQRPALAMAEVTLTIDNTAGDLPLEFSEVTVTRTLFRSGEAEYRLNGLPCRLLDVREVLSDGGIGREQHTIIGQGHLDDMLVADPTQVRAYVEEAAGVAKHRRRKERALRRIAATEAHLVRVADVLTEGRRPLRPLRGQAEGARRDAAPAGGVGRGPLRLGPRGLPGGRGAGAGGGGRGPASTSSPGSWPPRTRRSPTRRPAPSGPTRRLPGAARSSPPPRPPWWRFSPVWPPSGMPSGTPRRPRSGCAGGLPRSRPPWRRPGGSGTGPASAGRPWTPPRVVPVPCSPRRGPPWRPSRRPRSPTSRPWPSWRTGWRRQSGTASRP